MHARLNDFIQLLRLDKPVGIWLLFFPAGWAVALAASQRLWHFEGIMLLGALVTRAAGCIANDLTDRRLDAQVERTRTRPLAAGRISTAQALFLLAALLGVALTIALCLPRSVLLLAFAALPMMIAYPWMKRLTWWPQLFLGFTFNLSALFGWFAAGGPLTLPAWTLYAACIFWTLGYDTVYALQDVRDDAAVGIRSTARRFGSAVPHFIACCYGTMFLLLGWTFWLQHCGALAWAGWAAAFLHAGWQWRCLRHAPDQAGTLFRSNQWLGLLVLGGLLGDRFMHLTLIF